MRATPFLAAGAIALGMAMPANAQQVIATTDLNLREGPGTRFSVITTVPGDQRLDAVFGCLPDRDWCEVQFRGNRGWVFADYLEVIGEGRRLGTIGQVGPGMGLPMARFEEADRQRWEQRYEGVQPQFDQRYQLSPNVPGATGTIPGAPAWQQPGWQGQPQQQQWQRW